MIYSRPLHGIDLERVIDITTDALIDQQLDLEALGVEVAAFPPEVVQPIAAQYLLTQLRTMQASINQSMLEVRALVNRKALK